MRNPDSLSRHGPDARAKPAPCRVLMTQAVMTMLRRAERASEVDPGRAGVFLHPAAHVLEPVTQAPPEVMKPLTARLAPWQERKILRYVGEHLCTPISNRDLADLAGLSASHFSRLFRSSFGVAPREYVIRNRLEHAKTLMRQTRSPLCQIALDSGFSDQAHMSRTFHAIVGSTPNQWRRAQAFEPGP